MKLSIRKEQEVRYLKCHLYVRYFEDVEISTIPNIKENSNPPMFGFKHDEEVKAYYLDWMINLNEGKIVDWNSDGTLKDDTIVKTHYKVVDQGIYWLLDEDKSELCKTSGYTPKILGQDEDGFGDYVYLTILPDGKIKDWDVNRDMIKELQQMLDGNYD